VRETVRYEKRRYSKERYRAAPERAFEARYVRFLAAFFCVLGIVQGLLRFDNVRRFLNESIRLEGEPLARAVTGLQDPVYTWIPWPPYDDADVAKGEVATFYLRSIGDSSAKVWVLVNGRAVKRITPEDGTFVAKNGDLIEVAVESGSASLVLSGASENVLSPEVGTWIKGSGIMLLGRVRTVAKVENRER